MTTRRVLGLAVPALGALAADPLLSLVDTAFVGRLGEVELAALGVDTSIFNFVFAVFNFLAYATTPMVAAARGRGDVAESGRVVQRALLLGLLVGVGSAAVVVAAAPALVRLMQAAPEVVDPAVVYLRIRALSLPALLVVTAAHGAYRGLQDTRTPFLVTLGVNSLNAALDPLLIFGLGWGLAGAAVATLAAQLVGGGAFGVLLRRRGRREGWDTRVRLGDLRQFLAVGGGLVVRTLMLVTTLSLATATAARIGTLAVAAHQVVAQVWFLLAMTVDAVAIAAQALVGESVGRGDRGEARRLAGFLLRWGWALGAVLGLALWALRQDLGAWFSPGTGVRDLVAQVVPIAALMQPAAAAVFVADGIFMGLLAVRRLAGSTAVGLVAAAVVLAATLWLDLGLAGVWWAIAAMIAGRGVVLWHGHARGWTLSSA